MHVCECVRAREQAAPRVTPGVPARARLVCVVAAGDMDLCRLDDSGIDNLESRTGCFNAKDPSLSLLTIEQRQCSLLSRSNYV